MLYDGASFARAAREWDVDTVNYFHNYGNMEKKKVIAALSALAQDTRLDIMRTLMRRGLEGLPAGAIGRALNLPPATLSFHLNALRHAGLVVSHRKSRSIVYAADFSTMNATMAYLMENCCRGDIAEKAKVSPRTARSARAGRRSAA